MNRVTKTILAVIAAVVVLGIAGRCDYNEAVIYNMPDGVYEAMKAELGDGASDSRIADEYVKNREYWDQFK